jgi:hypothetical protein
MLPEREPAEAHTPGPECLDPSAGWDLVQYDWGMRQSEDEPSESTGPLGPIGPRSCPVARILAAPIAAVHALLRRRVRC